MALEPFLVNPPARRKIRTGRSLLAFGLNPRRRRRRGRKNPFTRVHFPSHTETLFRRKTSGRWGVKKRHKNPRKGVTPPWLKKFLFKKGHRALKRKSRLGSPVQIKGATLMRHRRKHHKNPVVLGNPRRRHSRRSARHHRRRNPVVLGSNPRRRRHIYRRNPNIVSKLGLPPMKEILFLGAGAFAGRLAIPQVLARIPILNTNPIIRGITRLGLTAVLGMIARPVLKGNAKMFTLGVLANQVPEAVNDFLSMTGIKLADGNAELEMFTIPQSLPVSGRPLGLYTLSEEEGNVV